MEEIQRRLRQNEQERFDKEVEQEFQKALEELDSISLVVQPNDVEITSDGRGYWEHELMNESSFDVVVRVRATTSSAFAVSRHPHKIRSHHLKFDVTKRSAEFRPTNLHDYFIGPYVWKTFIVRYHGAPRYWLDALEVNDWCMNSELTDKLEKDMRAVLAQSKEKDTEPDQYVDPDGPLVPEARMNLTNVIFMATNVSYGSELELKEGEDESFEDSGDDKKNR
uniref:Uncharacterized protein n=1 Tax=Caenorhabditis japonica TaxID=281687 RepID=A0A8R1E0X3_CAEJA